VSQPTHQVFGDLVALVIALTAGGGIMTETEMKPR
jgi:hypothetical protein